QMEAYTLTSRIRQQVSTTTNLAFRDYFKGVIRTNDIYLGDPTPASSGQMWSAIAIPVYSLKDNSTVVGLWAGGIDFGILNKELQSLVNIAPSSEGADNNGNEISALIIFERGDSIRARFSLELFPASIKITDSIMPLKKKIQRLSIQFLV
ncbi:MAG TPA: hypothetical protein VI278_02590, partial [Nitrososphaeraceae archaeon]